MKMTHTRFFSLWGPVVLWMGVIFFFSSLPSYPTKWGWMDFVMRKAAHITEFAFLTVLLLRGFIRSFSLTRREIVRYVFVVALLYAISDEIHQLFVLTRHGNFIDVLIDTFGIIIVLFFFQRRLDELHMEDKKRIRNS